MKRIFLIGSAFIPLLGLYNDPPDTAFLIYSVFILAYFFWLQIPKVSGVFKFVSIVIASGFLTEIFAWLENYLECALNPVLLHPQLFADLLSAIGFYGSWGIAWVLLLKRYRFRLREVFIVQGLYGVFIEQQGSTFLSGLEILPLGIFLWLYTFLVYGSSMGISFLFTKKEGQINSRWKYPVVLLVLLISTLLVSSVWGLLLSPILPEKGLICERPVW